MMKLRTQLNTRMALALLLTIGGIGNVAAQTHQTKYGAAALSVDTGDSNSAFGENALLSNTTGSFNTATGLGALQANTTAIGNTATGVSALFANTTGFYNTAVGANSLLANTTGSVNTSTGFSALASNTTGSDNNAFGSKALYLNTTGVRNTAVGNYALVTSTTGNFNNAVGYGALWHTTTGASNSASGYVALFSNTTGSNNIAVGTYAGYYPTTGSNNIEIGSRGAAADNAVIRIGTQGTQTTTFIAGVSGVVVSGGATIVVNSLGQLGVRPSSRRYKEDIRSMGDSSDRLLKLRPVTFEYKQPDEKGKKPKQYGLIAEEVAQVMPELVVYNQKGQPEAVTYEALAPLLLNELQRERKRAEQQTSDLRQQLVSVNAQLAQLRRQMAQPTGSRELQTGKAEPAGQVTIQQ